MAGRSPFTWAHVSSLAARAGDLEHIGEETQNPRALIRAARLYKLAVRIADDVAARGSSVFTHTDLARVRAELRTLATDTTVAGMLGDRGPWPLTPVDPSGDITRLFREIAARIAQRLAAEDTRLRHRGEFEPRA
jgi:hypothetical protein